MRKILVVDDESNMRFLLRMVFETEESPRAGLDDEAARAAEPRSLSATGNSRMTPTRRDCLPPTGLVPVTIECRPTGCRERGG